MRVFRNIVLTAMFGVAVACVGQSSEVPRTATPPAAFCEDLRKQLNDWAQLILKTHQRRNLRRKARKSRSSSVLVLRDDDRCRRAEQISEADADGID